MTALAQADIDAAAAEVAPERRAPWYVELFLGVGGWIAGLLAAAAIGGLVAVFFPNFRDAKAAAALALLIGAAVAVAGTLLARSRRGDFLRHFSIAAIAAGLTAGTFGFWYLGFDLLGGDDAGRFNRAAGYSGLATAAALAAAGFFASRAARDAILSFLVAASVYGVFAVSLTLLSEPPLVDEIVPAPWAANALDFLAPASALLGALLFTQPLGRRVASAAAAALLIAPMLHAEGYGRLARLSGEAREAMAPGLPDAVYAIAVVYCLWLLRARFAAIPLVAAAVPLLAGVRFLPPAGDISILILLAGMAGAHRGLAAVGVLALSWFIGAFYHDLSMTLLEKSALLAGLGALTLFGALLVRRLLRPAAEGKAKPLAARKPALATLGFGALLLGALGVVNWSVYDEETAYAEARTILLPLGPVDPRSLIQGDYMVLNFRETIYPSTEEIAALPETGEVFLRLDENGVAAFSRVAASGEAPAEGEIRIDYRKRGDGLLRYCPDSFFFQEGEADAFAAARFAVLKVAPDGRARLVALADDGGLLDLRGSVKWEGDLDRMRRDK
jgi:uncharacterized membrane-anchored protein